MVGDEKPSAVFERAIGWLRNETRFEFALRALLDAVASGHSPVRAGAGDHQRP